MTAPERIYLQDPDAGMNATWHSDQINKDDAEYVLVSDAQIKNMAGLIEDAAIKYAGGWVTDFEEVAKLVLGVD